MVHAQPPWPTTAIYRMAFVCHRLDGASIHAVFCHFHLLPQDPAIMHRGLDYRVRARKIRIHWATDFVVILSPWPSPGSHDQLPVTAPTHVRLTCHLRLVLKGRPRLKRRTPLSPRLRSRTWPLRLHMLHTRFFCFPHPIRLLPLSTNGARSP